MALKLKFKSKDEIPAEHVSLYVERGGAFVLDAEDGVEKAKLDEVRMHNVTLQKQIADLNERFEGIDPDQVKALMAEKQKLEEAKHLKEGEVEKLVESRTRSLKSDLEKQVGGLKSERDAVMSRLVEIEINQGVTLAPTKRRLRPTAIPDAVARARKVFQLVAKNGLPHSPVPTNIAPG